ncbi:hypothetical protein [Kutzneria buriramensis]|uniref:Uncharacterized protein n=1 Tax=Kutzneria buriramensis TaxID=1045776 RepID=A0A3E0I6F1_9PSEU|nr:hypothetical protein [Kutzneria buriramensis]REH54303.1 hypothetical protein BCF44_102535 [Kutzneria buriramensis]
METLPCGHVAHASPIRLCEHLITEDPPQWARRLTGTAVEYDALCVPCADAEATPMVACVGCVEKIDRDLWTSAGWRGTPEIRHRDEPQSAPDSLPCEVIPLNDHCLAALPSGWLALTADGLVTIGGDKIHAVSLPAEEGEFNGRTAAPALHVSPDGRFAAVVTDYGRHGVVIDLADGSVALELDRGTYPPRRPRSRSPFWGTARWSRRRPGTASTDGSRRPANA